MPSTRKIIAFLADLLTETVFISAPLQRNGNDTFSFVARYVSGRRQSPLENEKFVYDFSKERL